MKSPKELQPIDNIASRFKNITKRTLRTAPIVGLTMVGLFLNGDNHVVGSPIAGLSNGQTAGDPILLPPDYTLSTEGISELRENIEAEFNIELQTLDEVSIAAPAARIFNGLEGLIFSYQNWNEQNLNLLERTLKSLPEKFYQPDKNGEKVHIILGSSTHCGSNIKDFIPFHPRQIILSSLYFRPEIPLSAAWVLAHEFGHLATTDSCKQTDSPYFDKIEEMLGANFEHVKQDLSSKIQIQAGQSGLDIEGGGLVPPVDSIKTPGQEEAIRLKRLEYGITNQEEFIAVIAESYFLGKDYFQRMYAPFFPKDVVDNLYKFAMDDIFDGTQYPNYHTIPS